MKNGHIRNLSYGGTETHKKAVLFIRNEFTALGRAVSFEACCQWALLQNRTMQAEPAHVPEAEDRSHPLLIWGQVEQTVSHIHRTVH